MNRIIHSHKTSVHISLVLQTAAIATLFSHLLLLHCVGDGEPVQCAHGPR